MNKQSVVEKEVAVQKPPYILFYFVGIIALITIGFLLLQREEGTPPEIIAQPNSGAPLVEKKEAILTLVSRGSEGLTSEEKRGIRRALAGSAGRAFNFTPEEVERILNVINN